MSYYYTWRGAPMGPISIEELIDLAETEALPRETSVWQEGQPAWVRLPDAMQVLGRPLPAPEQLPPPKPPEGLAVHNFETSPMGRPPARTIPWPPPDHAEPPPSIVTWKGAPPATPATGTPVTPAPGPVAAPAPRRARIPVPAKAQPPAAQPPAAAPAPEPEAPRIFAPRPILLNKPRKTATLRPPRARSLDTYGTEVQEEEVKAEVDLAPWAQEAAERASYTSSLTNTEEEEINTFAGPALNYGDIEPIIDRWNTPSGLRLAAPPPIPRSRQDFLDATLSTRIPDPVVPEKEQEMATCAISGESWPRSLMVEYKGKLVAPQYLQRLKDGDGEYMLNAPSPVRQWVRLILALLLIVVLVWIFWPILHPSPKKPAEEEAAAAESALIQAKSGAEPVSQDARILAARALTGEPWAARPVEQWPPILMAQDATFHGDRRVNKGSVFLVKALGGQVAGLTAITLLRPPNGLNPGITLDALNSQILTWKAKVRGPSEGSMNFTGLFGGLPARPTYYPDVVPLQPEPLPPTQQLPVTPLTPYPVAPALSSRAWLICAPENMPNATQVVLGGVIVEYVEGADTRFTIMLDQPGYAGGVPGSPVVSPQGYLLGVITGTQERPDAQGRVRQFTGEPNGAYIRILERAYDRPGM